MALQDDNFTTQVLLTSVLGTPSSSINGASISARSERAALEQAAGPSAAQHYTSRLSGKRVQLLNPDRPAPRGEGHRAALAHRQLAKKDRRAKKVLKALRSGARQNSVSIATRHSTSKGKEKAQEDIFQGTQAGARPLSRSQRRKLGLDELDENLSYASLLPLHELWLSYIFQVLGLVNPDGELNVGLRAPPGTSTSDWLVNPNLAGAMQAHIIKADLCGAEVAVVRSSNPALVGLQGLVARETERTFVLAVKPKQRPSTITQANGPSSTRNARANGRGGGTRVVPKQNTVFSLSITLPSQQQQQQQHQGPFSTGAADTPTALALGFELHGNQLVYKPADRAARKFKARRTVDF